MQLILASNSPRRKELLSLLGQPFSVAPADLDEQALPGEPADVYVQRLAEAKARAVAARLAGDFLVIAADTTVALDGQILGKPDGAAEAAGMLARLRDRTHQVHTALAVLRSAGSALFAALTTSHVHMRAYSPAEVQAYIDSGDPFDKAGAYAIQHAAFHPVDCLHGCYTNVVGMPLCSLLSLLGQAGFPVSAHLPQRCLSDRGAACSFGPNLLCVPVEVSDSL